MINLSADAKLWCQRNNVEVVQDHFEPGPSKYAARLWGPNGDIIDVQKGNKPHIAIQRLCDANNLLSPEEIFRLKQLLKDPY